MAKIQQGKKKGAQRRARAMMDRKYGGLALPVAVWQEPAGSLRASRTR